MFGWTADRDESFAVLDRYADAGGNFVDTADSYSGWVPGNRGGESEEIIGEWLRRRGRSDDVVVATKVGNGYSDFPAGVSAQKVVDGCEASLRRLGVEAIDLFYVHRDESAVPLEETLGALDGLVRAGKVRYVAASNYTAPRLAEALAVSEQGLARFVAVQNRFNLVDRDDLGPDVREVCDRHNVGAVAYSALARGFLTGKYRQGEELQTARGDAIRAQYLGDERAGRVLAAAERVAAARGVEVAQVALAWALAQPLAAVIASARTAAQLDALLPALSLALAPDELAALHAAG